MTLESMTRITQNALIGQAIGDALGVPVEFMSRADVRAINLRDMVGNDTPMPFDSRWGKIIPSGAWSDDTSMTIATIASIVRQRGQIYCDDIMKCFFDWWNKGKYCSINMPFGLGATVHRAMQNYSAGIPVLDCAPNGLRDNGNGALMRILPAALYCIFNNEYDDMTIDIINAVSGITHGHAISKIGCYIFTRFLRALISNVSIAAAWNIARTFDFSKYYDATCMREYGLLLSDQFLTESDSCIGETGYVVDTLMAAIYSMLHSHDFESSVLIAINLGYDTDTAATVTGALAGAYYGLESIPSRWLEKLRGRDMLENYASAFAQSIR